MQTSEKKLGCLKGIGRANKPNIGYISGSVNTASLPKGGKKQVSVIDGKLTFWIVGCPDVIVLPEDIANCTVVGAGMPTGSSETAKYGEQTKRAQEYAVVLDLEFTDGTTGKLEIKDFLAFNDVSVGRSKVNEVEWMKYLLSENYIPVVDGWLTPDGGRDEHYDDMYAPNGYIADINAVYMKAQSTNKIVVAAEAVNEMKGKTKLSSVCEALQLGNRFCFASEKPTHLEAQFIVINGKKRRYIRRKK